MIWLDSLSFLHVACEETAASNMNAEARKFLGILGDEAIGPTTLYLPFVMQGLIQ